MTPYFLTIATKIASGFGKVLGLCKVSLDYLHQRGDCLQSDLYTMKDGLVVRNSLRKIAENPTVELSSEFKKVFTHSI